MEAVAKELQVVLGDATFKKNRHEDELNLIFNKFYVF